MEVEAEAEIRREPRAGRKGGNPTEYDPKRITCSGWNCSTITFKYGTSWSAIRRTGYLGSLSTSSRMDAVFIRKSYSVLLARSNGEGKGAGIARFALVIGHWSLVIGHWSLVIGHWSLVRREARG